MDESIKYQFFRHSINTRQDEKIKALYRKEGWQGYGLFWALLEDLVVNGCKAKCDYEDISWDLRIDEETVKRIVENYGLFNVKGGYFWSDSLLAQMEEVTERYKRRAAAGAKGGRAKAMAKQSDGNMPSLLNEDRSNATAMLQNKDSNATVMQEQSHYNNIEEENKVEKNRGDKKKKDIRDDISSSDESDNRHVVADDETRNFDDRIGDNTFMSIMHNYMYRGSCRPSHEAIKLIDLMGPDWKTKDGRDFAGKEWEACCFWKVERDRKYIDAPRLSVNGCKGVDLFMEWMHASGMYDQDVYNAFRGLDYDKEKNVVVLSVSDERFVSLIEKKYIKQITPSFRRLFPGAKFEYKIFNILWKNNF